MIDEANGPITLQVKFDCHDTLPWLISVSFRRRILDRRNRLNKSNPAMVAKINIVATNYDKTLEFYRQLGIRIPTVVSEPLEKGLLA
jgi:hypothetical protein